MRFLALRAFVTRLGSRWTARRLDARLSEEFQDHLERATQDYIDRGMSPAEARRAARIAFGGVTQAAEACRDVSPLAPRPCAPPGRPLRAACLSEDTGAHRRNDPDSDARDRREHDALQPAERARPARPPRARSRFARACGACRPRWTRNRRVLHAVSTARGVIDVRVGHGSVVVGGGRRIHGRVHDRRLLGRSPAMSTRSSASARSSGVSLSRRTSRSRRRQCSRSPCWATRSGSAGCTAIPACSVARFAWRTCRSRSSASRRQASRASAISAEPDITVPLPAVALINGRPVDSIARRSSQWIEVVARLRPGVTLEQARARLSSQWPALQALTMPPDLSPAERDAASVATPVGRVGGARVGAMASTRSSRRRC